MSTINLFAFAGFALGISSFLLGGIVPSNGFLPFILGIITITLSGIGLYYQNIRKPKYGLIFAVVGLILGVFYILAWLVSRPFMGMWSGISVIGQKNAKICGPRSGFTVEKQPFDSESLRPEEFQRRLSVGKSSCLSYLNSTCLTTSVTIPEFTIFSVV